MPNLAGDGGGGGGGGGASGPLVPRAWATYNLGAGTESLAKQVGDVFTGINVLGTGDYELTLDPAAGITDPFSLALSLMVWGFTPRIAVAFPSLPSNLISLNTYTDGGVATAVAQVSIVLWYDG